jgi:RNA polymerase sigma-70 factor (ECF subfamily)
VPQDPARAEDLEEERRLITEAQAGDMTALRPVLARYAEPLYGGVILPRLRNPAAAEEVLRETFAVAIEKIATFRWEGHGIYGWLRQIATNKTYDVHRRAQRTARALTRLAVEPQPDAPAADDALIADEERRRASARVGEILERLTPRYRDALRLRLLEERPREECAARLGVTVPTFDVLFFRAVRSFRKHHEAIDAGQ